MTPRIEALLAEREKRSRRDGWPDGFRRGFPLGFAACAFWVLILTVLKSWL